MPEPLLLGLPFHLPLLVFRVILWSLYNADIKWLLLLRVTLGFAKHNNPRRKDPECPQALMAPLWSSKLVCLPGVVRWA